MKKRIKEIAHCVEEPTYSGLSIPNDRVPQHIPLQLLLVRDICVPRLARDCMFCENVCARAERGEAQAFRTEHNHRQKFSPPKPNSSYIAWQVARSFLPVPAKASEASSLITNTHTVVVTSVSCAWPLWHMSNLRRSSTGTEWRRRIAVNRERGKKNLLSVNFLWALAHIWQRPHTYSICNVCSKRVPALSLQGLILKDTLKLLCYIYLRDCCDGGG